MAFRSLLLMCFLLVFVSFSTLAAPSVQFGWFNGDVFESQRTNCIDNNVRVGICLAKVDYHMYQAGKLFAQAVQKASVNKDLKELINLWKAAAKQSKDSAASSPLARTFFPGSVLRELEKIPSEDLASNCEALAQQMEQLSTLMLHFALRAEESAQIENKGGLINTFYKDPLG